MPSILEVPETEDAGVDPPPALIVTVKLLELVIPFVSVTNAIKVNGLPVVVLGVPESTPPLDRLVPVGTVPLDTLQVRGAVPPEAVSVWE